MRTPRFESSKGCRKLGRSPNLDDARESGQRRGIVGESSQFLGERVYLPRGSQPIAKKRPANELHGHRSHMLMRSGSVKRLKDSPLRAAQAVGESESRQSAPKIGVGPAAGHRFGVGGLESILRGIGRIAE